MSKKDYYSILWVERTATEEDIKKAYRKLAMQYHPDRNPGNHESEAKFKEINEAYSVIGDSSKRAQFDRFWSVGGDAGFSGFWEGVDLSDIFEGFFGGWFSQRSRRSSVRKWEDLEYKIKIDLKTSIYGWKDTFTFQRYDECEGCNGEWGKWKTQCHTCRWSGYVKYRQESFFWVIESSRACNECEWSGEIFKEVCHVCQWNKRKIVETKMDIEIPAWIDDGMIIKLTGEWNIGVGTKARWDLYVKFDVELEEKWLKRDDVNLYYDLEVDILEAILWNEKEVHIPILGKRKIKIHSGTQYGTVLKFSGDGVKQVQRDSKWDLFIKIIFDTPKKLSKKEKELFKELAQERKIDFSDNEWILWKIFW